jgi:hypothetical protein
VSRKTPKTPKKLVVEFDVTPLSKGEIDELSLEVAVQGEESDGQGGKHYDGETGHPSVSVIGSKVLKSAGRLRLVVEFDVTGLTKDQIGWLASEAEVQAERSEGHPDIGVSSKVVARGGK